MPEELTDARWFVFAGLVFVLVAVSGSVLRRLPVSGAIVYLLLGVAVGPLGLGLLALHPVEDAGLVELIAEIAVIVSLFTAGLKLRDPISDRRWRRPLRLAFVSMAVTVGLVAMVGHLVLSLPIGAAVILGAVLAPTDPVLASDVQVEHPTDRDELRFSLTGEAGFNDGTAFPFIMLGLGLLGLHELGAFGVRWLVVDVGWAVAGGLAVGAGLGMLVARVVLYLRRTHREAMGLDEFLCLGLIALSYGTALLLGTYAFLAVFAAGLAVRTIERSATELGGLDEDSISDPGAAAEPVDVAARPGDAAADPVDVAADPAKGPAHMARELLGFNERLERIGEVVIVVLLGAMLSVTPVPGELAWFAPLVFLLIRPAAVVAGLLGSRTPGPLLGLIGWFGIRGAGSLYYLAFAMVHGLGETSATLAGLVLWTVAISIVIHGISVTPLMHRYERWRRRTARDQRPATSPGHGTGMRIGRR